jgi:hypothetical protein
MRKLVVVLAVLSMVAPNMVRAGEGSAGEGKDRCLLYGEKCPATTSSISEIIVKLQKEIRKGEAVYTPREIAALENKLRQYHEYYEVLAYE